MNIFSDDAEQEGRKFERFITTIFKRNFLPSNVNDYPEVFYGNKIRTNRVEIIRNASEIIDKSLCVFKFQALLKNITTKSSLKLGDQSINLKIEAKENKYFFIFHIFSEKFYIKKFSRKNILNYGINGMFFNFYSLEKLLVVKESIEEEVGFMDYIDENNLVIFFDAKNLKFFNEKQIKDKNKNNNNHNNNNPNLFQLKFQESKIKENKGESKSVEKGNKYLTEFLSLSNNETKRDTKSPDPRIFSKTINPDISPIILNQNNKTKSSTSEYKYSLKIIKFDDNSSEESSVNSIFQKSRIEFRSKKIPNMIVEPLCLFECDLLSKNNSEFNLNLNLLRKYVCFITNQNNTEPINLPSNGILIGEIKSFYDFPGVINQLKTRIFLIRHFHSIKDPVMYLIFFKSEEELIITDSQMEKIKKIEAFYKIQIKILRIDNEFLDYDYNEFQENEFETMQKIFKVRILKSDDLFYSDQLFIARLKDSNQDFLHAFDFIGNLTIKIDFFIENIVF